MPEQKPFRVGITPDWGERTYELAGPALQEVLAPLPDLEYELMPATGGVADPEIIDRYDALIVYGYSFPREAFENVQRLKCVARWGVGYDKVDATACTDHDVLLAITPNAVRRPVAEGIIALIFALAKSIRNYDIRVRAGIWRENLPRTSVSLEGRTLGTVGLGNIAGEMLKIARGVGFGRLLAADPFITAERAKELGAELVDLPTLLRESDFVSISVPLSPATTKLISIEELALMKPTAFLVNTSRGAVVDEDALLEVLKNRKIAGAGLDVLVEEPPPKDHPFFQLDNVILSPHAVSWTEENIRDLGLETCGNIKYVYDQTAPPNLANPEVLERPGMKAKLAWRQA